MRVTFNSLEVDTQDFFQRKLPVLGNVDQNVGDLLDKQVYAVGLKVKIDQWVEKRGEQPMDSLERPSDLRHSESVESAHGA